MSGTSRWNPLGGLARSWGHFVRRPRSTQIRTLAVVGAVLIGTTVWVVTAPPGSTTQAAGGQSAQGAVPVSQASTSTRGVTPDSINVAFPIVSLSSLAGREGFAADLEFGEQSKAIQLYVKEINDSGGINGRMINPIITTFDPLNQSAIRALCKTWTEGSPAAFAVVDGHQLDDLGLALPLVDRSRPGGHPQGGGGLGAERRAARRWPKGGGGCR